MLNIFNIAGSALGAQSVRLNTVASNLANAESVAGPNGEPYKAKRVVFQTIDIAGAASQGVGVSEVTEDSTPPRLVFDPKHPMANKDGYVGMPNVNVVEEMVNMISASRSYQNNAEVMNTVKTLMQKTLQLGA